MGGGYYRQEVRGNREKISCKRHKVGSTHFVLVSFFKNVFDGLVRWLDGFKPTGEFCFSIMEEKLYGRA